MAPRSLITVAIPGSRWAGIEGGGPGGGGGGIGAGQAGGVGEPGVACKRVWREGPGNNDLSLSTHPPPPPPTRRRSTCMNVGSQTLGLTTKLSDTKENVDIFWPSTQASNYMYRHNISRLNLEAAGVSLFC